MPRAFRIFGEIAIEGLVKADRDLKGLTGQATKAGRTLDTKLGRAATSAERSFKRLNDTVQRNSQVLQAVGGVLAGFGAAAGAALASVAVKGAQFDTQMRTVAAVTQASAAELEALESAARRMGASTSFSAAEAGSGLEFLARAGFSAAEAIAALPGSLALAEANNLDLGRSADIVSNVLSNFGLQAHEAGRAVDVLHNTARSANTNVEQMGEAMSYAGLLAAKSGQSIEDTATALGLMANNGIQASAAGTALARAISSMLAPTPAAAKAFAKLGIETRDTRGEFIGIKSITEQLAESQQRLANDTEFAAAVMDAFGERGARGMLALASSGTAAFEELRDQVGQTNTTTADAERMMAGLEGSWKRFISAVGELQIAILRSGFGEFLQSIMERITGVVRWLGELNPKLLRLGAIAGSVAAAMGVAIGGLLIALPTLTIALHGVGTAAAGAAVKAGVLTTALGGMRVALIALTGPVGWVVAGVTTLIGLGLAHWLSQSEDESHHLEKALRNLGKAADDTTAALSEAEREFVELSVSMHKEAEALEHYVENRAGWIEAIAGVFHESVNRNAQIVELGAAKASAALDEWQVSNETLMAGLQQTAKAVAEGTARASENAAAVRDSAAAAAERAKAVISEIEAEEEAAKRRRELLERNRFDLLDHLRDEERAQRERDEMQERMGGKPGEVKISDADLAAGDKLRKQLEKAQRERMGIKLPEREKPLSIEEMIAAGPPKRNGPFAKALGGMMDRFKSWGRGMEYLAGDLSEQLIGRLFGDRSSFGGSWKDTLKTMAGSFKRLLVRQLAEQAVGLGKTLLSRLVGGKGKQGALGQITQAAQTMGTTTTKSLVQARKGGLDLNEVYKKIGGNLGNMATMGLFAWVADGDRKITKFLTLIPSVLQLLFDWKDLNLGGIWDWIKDGVGQVGEFVKAIGNAAVKVGEWTAEMVKAAAGNLWKWIKQGASAIGGLIADFGRLIAKFGSWVATTTARGLAKLWEWTLDGARAIGQLIVKFGELIAKFAVWVARSAKQAALQLWDWAKAGVKELAKLIAQLVKLVAQLAVVAAKKIATTIWDWIGFGLKQLDRLIDKITGRGKNSVLDAFGQLGALSSPGIPGGDIPGGGYGGGGGGGGGGATAVGAMVGGPIGAAIGAVVDLGLKIWDIHKQGQQVNMLRGIAQNQADIARDYFTPILNILMNWASSRGAVTERIIGEITGVQVRVTKVWTMLMEVRNRGTSTVNELTNLRVFLLDKLQAHHDLEYPHTVAIVQHTNETNSLLRALIRAVNAIELSPVINVSTPSYSSSPTASTGGTRAITRQQDALDASRKSILKLHTI